MIKAERPSLRKVSSAVYYSCWFFVILNLFFISPAILLGASSFLPLVGLFSPLFWAVVFIGLGLGMAHSLVVNDWEKIKVALFVALFVKALFAWALLLVTFSSPITIGTLGIWLGMMVWGTLCIVYFTPEMKNGARN